MTLPVQPNTTVEYVAYGPQCDDMSCASILTATESTSPTSATTPATITPDVRRVVSARVRPHRGDLLRRVYVQHLLASGDTVAMPLYNNHLYTSASETTGFNIFGVQFGVREDEYANFWTYGSLANGNLQRAWWTSQPTCQPGSGISVGAAATTNSCSWWYSPPTGQTGEMSARDYWTASAAFKGFPVSDGHSIFIHVR